jgi:hypothetical protein
VAERVGIPAVSFCPSDPRPLIRVTTLSFVIPSEAEGPAVRPGSLTKVCVLLVPTQTLKAVPFRNMSFSVSCEAVASSEFFS